MIDFDKAEFLGRLDVRFAAFSALLEMHEKYIISLCTSNKVFIDATKAVERHHRELYDFINKTDKKIYDFFEKAKSEADKQQTSTADVVEVRHSRIKWVNRPISAQYATVTDEYGEKHYGKVHDFIENNPVGYCEECGKKLDDTFMNYCPNCGAKMDGERSENGT